MRDLRSSAFAAVAVLTCASLVGCAPDPEPTPTPQATFATEAEAFAAAEAVYRAYVDASGIDEDSLQYVSGALYQDELEALRSLEERNVRIVGVTEVVRFRGVLVEQSSAGAMVTAETCIDVSKSRLLDSNGTDLTPSGRADFWVLNLSFSGTPQQLFLTAVDALDSGASC